VSVSGAVGRGAGWRESLQQPYPLKAPAVTPFAEMPCSRSLAAV